MMDDRGRTRELGLLAIGFYGVHGAYHWFYGFPENLFWICHVGALVVGLRLLLGSAKLNGVGLLCLAFGTPLWLVGLAGGGTFVPTSILTHVGGLTIGLWGVTRLGLARGIWWKALVGVVVLHALSRWTTPADKNVNLARGVWKGFERYFPSDAVFLALVFVACAALFFGLEMLLQRTLGNRRE